MNKHFNIGLMVQAFFITLFVCGALLQADSVSTTTSNNSAQSEKILVSQHLPIAVRFLVAKLFNAKKGVSPQLFKLHMLLSADQTKAQAGQLQVDKTLLSHLIEVFIALEKSNGLEKIDLTMLRYVLSLAFPADGAKGKSDLGKK
jgi:hypothetical protein